MFKLKDMLDVLSPPEQLKKRIYQRLFEYIGIKDEKNKKYIIDNTKKEYKEVINAVIALYYKVKEMAYF